MLIASTKLFRLSCLRNPSNAFPAVQSFSHTTVRTVRNKAARPSRGLLEPSIDESIAEDEKKLQDLLNRLQSAKARLAEEKKTVKKTASTPKNVGLGKTQERDDPLAAHHQYFWENVLSSADRKKLTENGIYSLDDLYAGHEAAHSLLTRPPFPNIHQLEPKLRVAHQMYESIPQKLLDAGSRRESP